MMFGTIGLASHIGRCNKTGVLHFCNRVLQGCAQQKVRACRGWCPAAPAQQSKKKNSFIRP